MAIRSPFTSGRAFPRFRPTLSYKVNFQFLSPIVINRNSSLSFWSRRSEYKKACPSVPALHFPIPFALLDPFTLPDPLCRNRRLRLLHQREILLDLLEFGRGGGRRTAGGLFPVDQMRGKAKNYSAQKRESLSEKLGRCRTDEFIPRPHFGSPSFLSREMIFGEL